MLSYKVICMVCLLVAVATAMPNGSGSKESSEESAEINGSARSDEDSNEGLTFEAGLAHEDSSEETDRQSRPPKGS